MPKVSMEVMATFQRKWRKQGILCYIYLGDSLVIGHSKMQVDKHLKVMAQDLLEVGFKNKHKKRVSERQCKRFYTQVSY